MSAEACADGGHSWTLRRISNGGSGVSDYLGVCTKTLAVARKRLPLHENNYSCAKTIADARGRVTQPESEKIGIEEE